MNGLSQNIEQVHITSTDQLLCYTVDLLYNTFLYHYDDTVNNIRKYSVCFIGPDQTWLYMYNMCESEKGDKNQGRTLNVGNIKMVSQENNLWRSSLYQGRTYTYQQEAKLAGEPIWSYSGWLWGIVCVYGWVILVRLLPSCNFHQ